MKTIAEIGSERLKNVIIADKKQEPSKVLSLINSDVSHVLSSFMELSPKGVTSEVDIDEHGIKFIIVANAYRMKEFGCLPDNY